MARQGARLVTGAAPTIPALAIATSWSRRYLPLIRRCGLRARSVRSDPLGLTGAARRLCRAVKHEYEPPARLSVTCHRHLRRRVEAGYSGQHASVHSTRPSAAPAFGHRREESSSKARFTQTKNVNVNLKVTLNRQASSERAAPALIWVPPQSAAPVVASDHDGNTRRL